MKIGFFDSGIGGLTVLRHALTLMPNENYIYYADSMHVPYGEKSKSEVRQYVSEALEFFSQRQVKAVVIACNTATSATTTALRRKFGFPVIGIEPAVKPAIKNCQQKNRRVLVLATTLTLREEKYCQLIAHWDEEHIVDGVPLPRLVEYAESFEFDEHAVMPYLVEQLSNLDLACYGTIVLGCTHFPFYKGLLRKLFPANADIIDGSTGTINHLRNTLAGLNQLNGGTGIIEYYASGIKIEDPRKIERYTQLLNGLCHA